FQESTIPLAKNIIPEHSPNACMPFKAYMMFSAPPIDDELFDDTLHMEGLDYDIKGKEQLLRDYLNVPEMGASFLKKVEHFMGYGGEEGQRQLEYNARIAGNHPLMMLVFQNKDIRDALKIHTEKSGQCNSEQIDRYNQATDADYRRFYDEKLATLIPLCGTGTGREYRRCVSEKEGIAREYANSKLPRRQQWAKEQNNKKTGSEPICETEKDFFQKQENINEIIKAQNDKCNNFRKTIGPEFLCKDDISNFDPSTLELELGPKIFEAFGSDGPRIFNHYMKKNYCSITSEGKGVPKPKIGPSKLEEFGIVDHLRPKSNLTDLRTGKESDYDRYNKFLCSKMNGRRPDGSTFSCANNSARPPECNQSIYFKQMACQALKSELDGVRPVMSEEDKRDYFLTPEEYGDVHHHNKFPSSRESLDRGPMILEFQRLANTLPGDLGANCALPNPLPSDSATVSSWFAS
ncbi:MAG: hypothetical protein HYV97_16285, partial [Bdellovibrio sp.]|nr:hypothetical protein [Bdellovibrio sp.]